MFQDKRKNLIYLLVLLVPFLLFFSRSEIFSRFKFQLVNATTGPFYIVSLPFKEIKKMVFYHRTFEEYKRFKKETDTLRGRVMGFEEVVKENARLNDLLAFKRRLVYSSLAAHVIGRNPSFWNASILIDKGEKDGVKQGSAVVNAAGVVGKVAEVGPETSKVILLTDPQFSVASLIQRTRESGLVSGTLEGVCRIRYVAPSADIRVGDTVITSKLSTSFPEGLLVGEIVSLVQTSGDRSVIGIVRPAISLSQLEEVLVILEK
ncbi:MAG: rod shape-determining protein MreC [Candidatus Omnitrophota bacterium]|nr:rod shape-determining protein MreC [Candidatus Omnitrophota bacterium]